MSDQIIKINCQENDAGRNFVKSLRNTGFAILYNHSLNTELITEVYEEWNHFFNSEEKHNYTFDPDRQDGYFPFRSENAKGYDKIDLKELFHYYEWGRYPKNISDNKIDQILISAEFIKGHNPKVKNTMKKTKPKLLLEFILSFFLFK